MAGRGAARLATMTHRYTVLHGGTVLTFDGAMPADAACRALRRSGHA